ncbi:MAG TPA: endolytic transglycosylase MltG [Gammaproteobacteria bacterium]|nr:endolytic transglycosylase MltG [Gammaproteobacteria bacterium]
MGFRLLGLLLIVLSFVSAWLIMDFQNFRQAPLDLPEAGIDLVVKPGSTLRKIARELQQRGIVRQPLYLVLLGRYLGHDARIKAGEYHLQPGLTPEALLQQLTEGKVVQHGLTLIEGENFGEMMQRVASDPVLEHRLPALDADTVMNAIGHPGEHPEGRFLPETYHFPRGTSDIEFLRRAYAAMEEFLQQNWPQRDKGLPLASPYEALILASIVEKETGLPEERPRIAGVFIRRLQKGMKLQTDPTVIYGMGDDYKGDIRFRDLRRDTPYNTYTRNGLPPTPIAMPGKGAIQAVLHPAPGKELYFVARGDGSHQFSATLKAHNRAVDRYQRKRKR